MAGWCNGSTTRSERVAVGSIPNPATIFKKGSADVRKFMMGIRRLGASLAALLMICCLSAPALAANDWPASPSFLDFYNNPNCWNVWKRTVIRGVGGYELICEPMLQYNSTDTPTSSFNSYSTDSFTYSYANSSGVGGVYMCAFPYIPASVSSFWPDLPSFPVGEPSNVCGAVRLYPIIRSGYLSNISDVFSDRSVFGFLTSWPSFSSTSLSINYPTKTFTEYPVYVPSNVFFFGDRSVSSSGSVSGFGITHGDNDFWASPSNSNYLKLSKSHITSDYRSFPSNFTIPSSDVGLVFAKQPEGNQMHAYNTEFNVSDLRFVPTLWVPDSLLPADVAVGDWISKADVESLQDQLVKDFDVNSDTLKNSKQNFDSWQNSNTIDTDVADTGLSIINALMQNVGQFAFIVSLLCFGAVVLRVLIRKAVEG